MARGGDAGGDSGGGSVAVSAWFLESQWIGLKQQSAQCDEREKKRLPVIDARCWCSLPSPEAVANTVHDLDHLGALHEGHGDLAGEQRRQDGPSRAPQRRGQGAPVQRIVGVVHVLQERRGPRAPPRLLLLVLQNSSVFVVTRYTRIAKGRLYLPSVVLLIVELFKLLICVVLISREAAHSPRALAAYLYESVWVQRKSTMLLGVPAVCYAVQNNLIFVAIGNLSAAAAQVLYQLKTLSTALFTVALMKK